jgi:hypothetical protein
MQKCWEIWKKPIITSRIQKKPFILKLMFQKTALFIFLFNEEKETIDWIDDMVGQWWDDETI